jgi:hypothetical protein
MKNNFIDLLKPQNVFLTKKRFGPDEDGGYVMLDFVLENCSAVFAYGVGGDTRFEEDFFTPIYKKPVYLFDHTIRRMDDNPGFHDEQRRYWKNQEERWESRDCHFFPHGLGFQEKCKDFIEDYQELNINGEVLLKIDIEGGEYEYFSKVDISKMDPMVMGMILEVHWIGETDNREKLVNILNELNKYFILFHIHGNNWGKCWKFEKQLIPETFELSFVNRRFVEKYESDNQEYPINGLDLPNNYRKKDYKLSFLSDIDLTQGMPMQMAIGDVVDKYTICKLKSEREEIDNSKEMNDLQEEMDKYGCYPGGIQDYINALYDVNKEIWDLELIITKENINVYGFEDIGQKALRIRDLNIIKDDLIINRINPRYSEGYVDMKCDDKKDPSLIISLTTVPERLADMAETGIISTIKSLCEQEDNDYEIHFNIPEIYNITKAEYIIPEWLYGFQIQYPNLKIFRTEDYGPPTKFVPTLNRVENPETILLVVDDDLVYHPKMISEHRKYQNILKDCVLCYDGREPKFLLYGPSDMRDCWISCVTEIREVEFLQHYKSVSYKKKLFTQEFYDFYLGKTLSDDILVSTFLTDNDIRIFVIPYAEEIPLFITKELWDQNLGVTTFPVLRHTTSVEHTGCHHPGLLALPTGDRFYMPPNFSRKHLK